MKRRVLGRADTLAAAVVVAALVAGCGALAGGESTATVTPAPVPTENTAFPPGVSPERVSSATLVSAHQRTLSTTNYTLRSHQRVVGPNGTVQEINRTRVVAAGGETFVGRFERTVVGSPLAREGLTLEYWSNGSAHATREAGHDAQPTYGWSRGADPSVDVDFSMVLARTFDAIDVRVVDRSADGVILTGSRLLHPDRLPNQAALSKPPKLDPEINPDSFRRVPRQPYLSQPRNVSLTSTVTDDGVVVRWRLAYDATVNDQSVRVVWQVAFIDVGTTAVVRPEWVDTARQEDTIPRVSPALHHG